MADFDTKLIRAVRQKREAQGLSIRALAAIVGVSFSSLARIERGDGTPDNNSKIRLIEWLGAAADEAGLTLENVALVHFRAAKNVKTSTVQALLQAAQKIRGAHPSSEHASVAAGGDDVVSLTKDDLENIASRFRHDLGISDTEPLDPLKLEIEGIHVVACSKNELFDKRLTLRLCQEACSEWSAMSVPLNYENHIWSVLLNDCHTIERQRVTILEEFWHILLGHKLTKVAKVADSYGRTYDSAEEHDAYFLASATLLPRKSVTEAVAASQSSLQIAKHYGTSPELVDYRVKRLGLWREWIGKKVALNPTSDKPRSN